MKKEDLDADPQSMDNRRLSSIARNPNHPMATHAKAELARRKVKKAELSVDEGAMKRIATTQSNKADRMASTDKKGLETYKKKVDEISLDDLKAKISSSGMKSTKKAMGADKLKKDLEAMKAKLATEATDDEYHKTLANTKNSDEGIAALKKKHGMSHAKATATIKRLMGEAKDPEEYDNEGSMMKSQLRKIDSAVDTLMNMVKDDDNLPEWVQSKMTKATDYIRSVRDYLESEKMEEKTLTPAEKRKREKIAKAIERDNPDMPMDKKMAIATATAKRVAESADDFEPHMMYDPKTGKGYKANKPADHERMAKMGYTHDKPKVNEISSKTLSNYMRKSTASAGKPRQDVRTMDKRIGGQKMADDKLRKMQGKSSAAKVPAGKNEQTDLSRIRSILDRNKK